MSTEQFTQFARDHGIEMQAQSVHTRPDMQDPQEAADARWSKVADHFLVTLTRVPEGADPNRAPEVIWVGFYSTGPVHPLMWARENRNVFRRACGWNADSYLQRLKAYRFGRRSLYQDEALKEIRSVYRRLAPLDIGDVLLSLQRDSMGWESTFGDWCEDLGYDTDSRRALSIFEECQNTAKSLLRQLGRVNFDTFMNLEEV